MVKQIFSYILMAIVFIMVGWFGNTFFSLKNKVLVPKPTAVPTPLSKYSIPNLISADIKPGQIMKGDVIKEFDDFTQSKFYMDFDPSINGGAIKKVSGIINTPKSAGPFPLVVLFRGYADPTVYYMGLGTQPMASYLANRGFMTVAPDFLGYGESDKEASDVFETRFQTYTTALTLLKSTELFSDWDGKNIYIWGHSNGGQISLTVLEALGVNYPTVLWAPVSKPFPYSILYYTDEASDAGKFLRQKTSEFESVYDSDNYSLTNYFDQIKAPLLLIQGGLDDAVPINWSNFLVKTLKTKGVAVEYITYPLADHNLRPNWNEAAEASIKFFNKYKK